MKRYTANDKEAVDPDDHRQTETKTVEVCPDCDRTSFTTRRGGHSQPRNRDEPRHCCRYCGARFDHPKTRNRREILDPLNGLPGKLDAMDVEDIPALADRAGGDA